MLCCALNPTLVAGPESVNPPPMFSPTNPAPLALAAAAAPGLVEETVGAGQVPLVGIVPLAGKGQPVRGLDLRELRPRSVQRDRGKLQPRGRCLCSGNHLVQRHDLGGRACGRGRRGGSLLGKRAASDREEESGHKREHGLHFEMSRHSSFASSVNIRENLRAHNKRRMKRA